VVAVGSNGFEVRSSSGAPAEFAWPDALPVEVSVGDAVVVESSYDWTVLTLPRGQLVVSRGSSISDFVPPRTSPDGAASMRAFPGCEFGRRLGRWDFDKAGFVPASETRRHGTCVGC